MTNQQNNHHQEDQQGSQRERSGMVVATGQPDGWVVDQDYAAARAATWETAVEALSSAARLRCRTARVGEYVGEGRPLDFAEFLTGVLAAVTANVGSVDLLLAGRSGSWEADKLGDLLYSTVGYDGEYLIGHRTEPLVIEIDVDQYLSDTAQDWMSPFEAEVGALVGRFGHITTDEAQDAYDQEETALEERWQALYTAYGQAFTAAVRAEATTIPDLRVPVEITTISDLYPAYPRLSHPTEWGPDRNPLVWRLWAAGTRAIQHTIQHAEHDAELAGEESGERAGEQVQGPAEGGAGA